MMNLLALEKKRVCCLAHNDAVELMSHLNQMLSNGSSVTPSQNQVTLLLADGCGLSIQPKNGSMRHPWADDHATDEITIRAWRNDALSFFIDVDLDDGITFGSLVKLILKEAVTPLFPSNKEHPISKNENAKVVPASSWPAVAMH